MDMCWTFIACTVVLGLMLVHSNADAQSVSIGREVVLELLRAVAQASRGRPARCIARSMDDRMFQRCRELQLWTAFYRFLGLEFQATGARYRARMICNWKPYIRARTCTFTHRSRSSERQIATAEISLVALSGWEHAYTVGVARRRVEATQRVGKQDVRLNPRSCELTHKV
jgi:hypothetical protein